MDREALLPLSTCCNLSLQPRRRFVGILFCIGKRLSGSMKGYYRFFYSKLLRKKFWGVRGWCFVLAMLRLFCHKWRNNFFFFFGRLPVFWLIVVTCDETAVLKVIFLNFSENKFRIYLRNSKASYWSLSAVTPCRLCMRDISVACI